MINRLNTKFAQVNNEVLWNKNISLKAKGLYSYLCSCKDDWKFSIDGLSSALQEGEKAIKSGVKELVEAKYLLRFSLKVDGKFCGRERIVNPTEQDLLNYNDPCNRTVPFQDSAVTASSENRTENNNTKLNNTNTNNTINNLSGFRPLKEGDNIKNPPSSAAPPTQATSETIGQKANRLIQILGRDVTIPSVVSSLKKALEKDTRENILSGFENYAKKVSFGRVYPQTLLKDETYKQYIVEKEKPARLAKLEEMLASPKRRTHPTEQSSYGGMRQYQGLLPQEEEEYNKLSIEFYGEVMTKNVFRFYPE